MQRTNHASPSLRGAVALVVLACVALWVVLLPFLIGRAEPPAWLLLVGRWIPALCSLIALRWVGEHRGLARTWGLRPAGGWPRTLRWAGLGALVVIVAQVIQIGVGVAAGFVQWTPQDGWPMTVALFVPALAVVGMLSTLGEEVAWRGHLQNALARWGFWRATGVIAVVWGLWHLPLMLAYHLAGTMPLALNIVSHAGLVLLAPLLSALAVRGASVWPAALAHAVPPFAGVLVTVADPAAFQAVFLVAMGVAGLALAARTRPADVAR